MMNLHMLFTTNPLVIANMGKLLKADDAIVLIDEACSLNVGDILKSRTGIDVFSRQPPHQPEPFKTQQSLNDQQWLTLCNQAKLIHSWY